MIPCPAFVFVSGCSGTWDKITCWPSADIDQVVTIPCPKYLFYFSRNDSPRKTQNKRNLGCLEQKVNFFNVHFSVMLSSQTL